MTEPLKDPSFALAVAELVHLSGWSKADVIRDPHSAAWEAAAWVQKCRRKVEEGQR